MRRLRLFRPRLFSHTTLLLLLTLASVSSCVKLPRRTTVVSGFTAPDLARPAVATNSLVNINTASSEELEKLPGIGVALAARIIEHRGRHGAFRRAEHLIIVRGISERRFDEIRALITVD